MTTRSYIYLLVLTLLSACAGTESAEGGDDHTVTVCEGKCDGAADPSPVAARAPAGCDAELEYVKSSYDVWTGATTVSLSVLSGRPVDELAAVLDPQSWDRCSSRYFTSTYVTDDAGAQSPSPPPAGSAWDGMLYEEVKMDLAGYEVSRIQNLLGWSTRRLDPPVGGVEHRLDYWLDTSLAVEVPLGSYTPGLDVDDGFMTISRVAGGRHRVYGVKTIHFTLAPGLSAIVNAASPFIFRKVLGDLAYDLACCPAR